MLRLSISKRQLQYAARFRAIYSIRTVDLHAAGEPARVIVDGFPSVKGDTILAKRNYIMKHLDDKRKLLLQEPRGYPCQNANVIFPSSKPGVSFGFVILEQNKIYPMMSGEHYEVLKYS